MSFVIPGLRVAAYRSRMEGIRVSERSFGRPIVPKEHGAWAVIYGAFLAGVGVAGQVAMPVAFFALGVTAAAFANGPLVILARPASTPAQEERRRHALNWFLVYGAAAVVAFVPLILYYRMAFLLPLGIGAILFLLFRTLFVREKEDRSLPGELVGTAGLTMVGAAAHAVAQGEVQRTALILWLLLFLYFAGGVFYVRMRIQGMVTQRKVSGTPSTAIRWPCVVYHAVLIVALGALSLLRLVPWPILLAFAPALWRAAVGLRRISASLNVRRLGWSEVAVATAFVLLLIAAFRITPLAG
jgi:hypothetical protein